MFKRCSMRDTTAATKISSAPKAGETHKLVGWIRCAGVFASIFVLNFHEPSDAPHRRTGHYLSRSISASTNSLVRVRSQMKLQVNEN